MIRLRTATWAVAVAGRGPAPPRPRTSPSPRGRISSCGRRRPFDNDTAKKDDTFSAKVTHGLWVEGQPAIPAGSTVTGTVKSVRSGRRRREVGSGRESSSKSLNVGGQTLSDRRRPGEPQGRRAQEDPRAAGQDHHRPQGGRDPDRRRHGGEDMKVNTLVGISGADTDDLADEWAKSGLGPATVRVTPGTNLTMQFDRTLTLPGGGGGRARARRPEHLHVERHRQVRAARPEGPELLHRRGQRHPGPGHPRRAGALPARPAAVRDRRRRRGDGAGPGRDHQQPVARGRPEAGRPQVRAALPASDRRRTSMTSGSADVKRTSNGAIRSGVARGHLRVEVARARRPVRVPRGAAAGS